MTGLLSKVEAGWPAKVLGVVLAVIGVILIVGGVQLAMLGGSWYYLLAGLALAASGGLIFTGRVLGAWVYIATFILTVLWAFSESGLNGWALVPRVIAPLVLLLFVVGLLPSLLPDEGKKRRWQGFAGIAAFVVLLGLAVGITNRSGVQSPVAEAGNTLAFDTAAAAGREWPTYGGGPSAQRYADLNQINADNVKNLKVAWTYRTGNQPDKWGAETTPIKVGDTLYGCTGMNEMYALDPATGKKRWSFDPKVPNEAIPYTAACRGVTYYKVPAAAPGSPCAERIFEGTLDGRVIAVDARNGQPCQGFGTGGQVKITEGMGKIIPSMVAITAAPAIVQGVVVTGHQVQDGQYKWAPSGVIQGYDAITGQLRFAWDMMRPDRTGAPPPGDTYIRGTPNMWTTATGDEQLGYVYLPMGNSAADYLSGQRRPAEKMYSSGLVALDVKTGKPVWVFHTAINDVWDYDQGSQVSLVNFPVNGQMVPAILLPTKQGDFYVLDRRTGKALTEVGQMKAEVGGVEPQERSPVQPFSKYQNVREKDMTEASMWGMSPIDQMICRIQFRKASYTGPYTAPTLDRPFIEYPGYNGGSDWGSVAVDPRRGVVVANYNLTPNYDRLLTRKEADDRGIYAVGDPRNTGKSGAEGAGAQEGAPFAIDVNAGWLLPFTGMLCKQPPYGGIRAFDLKTGKTLWDHAFGDARRNGPFGIPSLLPITIGTPNNGGPAVTAGGLIFIAATTDNQFRAIDIRTGKTLWQATLPAGGQANPMIYEQNGRQYVVIMAGGHHFMKTPEGDYLIAYALPEKK
ncbi:membrane-bound PQQ-dependent dehydrogenase, glucose/quinate/shikimate family [Asticcacaulis sp.]|uniref:membrane-bound PQQ-dependent dehydrogenase, glucose/quinate/shikimate family n=1 Tax=Asticcacaulis sp. TaxID=1872648 RepID=UPI002BD128F5|nr:membrane-bound PQQ-dependent dehydrogenase, glucose/quinate/shikimate family [Asticcacaulis sp.]HTM82655.1 membrane-bound PQQ-dependent dehydrogenase, glucose/quinate/shikimate family [Asticcacaulis sp.]